MQLSPLDSVIPSWGNPTLEGYDVTDVQDGKRIKGNGRQFVRFYKQKFVEVATLEAKINPTTGSSTPVKTGTREIEREMVCIITPGDTNKFEGVAEDHHRREFWPHYKAFRDGRTAPLGTSIDECSFVSASMATELRYLGCHTLEQLADASDYLCGQIANGWELREFARAQTKANLDNRSLNQVNVLKGELEKSQALIADMQKQLNQMQGMLVNPSGEVIEAQGIKKSPGRPKKIVTDGVENEA